jgi:hypothetical protein
MLVVAIPQQGASLMTTEDFITELFYRVDEALRGVVKHSQASLYPSEIVTLGLLFALKGVGNRAFYRWLCRDWKSLFPPLPDRTRLFRLFSTHQDWTDRFLAEPSLLGVADTYGIELLHPMREGRSPKQMGKKGKSNHRWIVGGKLAFVLNHCRARLDTTVYEIRRRITPDEKAQINLRPLRVFPEWNYTIRPHDSVGKK